MPFKVGFLLVVSYLWDIPVLMVDASSRIVSDAEAKLGIKIVIENERVVAVSSALARKITHERLFHYEFIDAVCDDIHCFFCRYEREPFYSFEGLLAFLGELRGFFLGKFS